MSGPEPFLVNAASRLRAARVRSGLSQAEAARRCGIRPASWNDMETGKRPPTLDRLWGVAEALALDPADLDPRLASRSELRARSRKRGDARRPGPDST